MFPNARKGVKKLFIAEILTIFSAILGLVATVLTAIPHVAESGPGQIVLIVFALTALFFIIIAFALHIFGLFQGSRDSGHFWVAFWAAIFSIIFTIVASILKGAIPSIAWLHSIFSTLAQVLNAFVIIYVISGISSMALRLGKVGFAKRGTIMVWIILGLYLVAAVLNFLSGFFTAEAFVVFFGVITVASNVLTIIIYIAYLFYLLRATRIL